jgi:hypothetical protein
LGFEQTYTQSRDYVDPDDNEYHNYKANNSTLSQSLNEDFRDKVSVVQAINEDLVRTQINTKLIAGKTIGSDLDWSNILDFADSIKNQAFRLNQIHNLLDALNWVRTKEIGPFREEINSDISKTVDG